MNHDSETLRDILGWVDEEYPLQHTSETAFAAAQRIAADLAEHKAVLLSGPRPGHVRATVDPIIARAVEQRIPDRNIRACLPTRWARAYLEERHPGTAIALPPEAKPWSAQFLGFVAHHPEREDAMHSVEIWEVGIEGLG